MAAFRTPADIADLDPDTDLGHPGQFPFTRGIHPTMYRGRPWTIRQYAGFGSAQESNARYRYLLSQGGTGLSVAFDLPTQIGYDSDHPLAAGVVGRVGVAIDSIEDMEILLAGLPLDRVTTSMTINATAAILLLLYELVAEKQGVPPSRSGTTPCFSPTATYSARRMAAVALIVIDVVTSESGMPSKRRSMSSIVAIETPTFPTSPATRGSSGS
jgi:methylmalonyl-CoA mutase cobalamin-binding domain/chain